MSTGQEPYDNIEHLEKLLRDRAAKVRVDPPAAPFGPATCLNCGDQFFPDRDPNAMFCGDTCAGQYTSELGL